MKRLTLITFLLLVVWVNVGFTKAEDTNHLVTYTNLKGYINKTGIPVYNYNNKPMIKLYQLNYYRFDIRWEASTKTFIVTYNPEKNLTKIPVLSYKKGKKYGDAFECDIMASINGKIYPLVVVNGNHMLPLNALEPYGPVITYKEEHATHFTSYDTKNVTIHDSAFRKHLLDVLDKIEGPISMDELDAIDSLRFSNYDNIGYSKMSEDIGLLRNLESVSFAGAKQWTINPGSMSLLVPCQKIESITLDNCIVDDYGFFKSLPNIRKLSLTFNAITLEADKLSKITDIPTLEELIIAGYFDESIDMSLFNNLKNLKSLNIFYWSNRTFINIDKASYPELETLMLYGCEYATFLQERFKAPKLENFYLAPSTLESGIAMGMNTFNHLTTLKYLEIHDCINSLDGISSLTQLEEINLSDNAIVDISPLTSLQNLQKVNLRNNPIKDLSILDQLDGVEVIINKESE